MSFCIECGIVINTFLSWFKGCLPAPFRLNAAVGETVATSCQTINPAFNPRGVLTWKCMANQTWNGHLTGCTFSGDAKRVHLLAFTLQGPQDEVYNNASAIQREVSSYVCMFA